MARMVLQPAWDYLVLKRLKMLVLIEELEALGVSPGRSNTRRLHSMLDRVVSGNSSIFNSSNLLL